MDFFNQFGAAPPLPPAQFGGKQQEIMPGADADAYEVRSQYQDAADLHLGIGPGQFFQRLPGQVLAHRPVRYEQTARTVDTDAFDRAAVLRMGVNQPGVYLFTLEQHERETRNEAPLTRQVLTTPIAPIFNLERAENSDPTQVFLIGGY